MGASVAEDTELSLWGHKRLDVIKDSSERGDPLVIAKSPGSAVWSRLGTGLDDSMIYSRVVRFNQLCFGHGGVST